MECAYCGIGLQPGMARCGGCGAPSSMPLAEPAGTAATIYEQIGRAVVNREPNAALDRLLHVGERQNASDRERKTVQWGKILFCLFIVWHMPWLLAVMIPLGIMFFLWIYLPYRGVKAVLGWLSG